MAQETVAPPPAAPAAPAPAPAPSPAPAPAPAPAAPAPAAPAAPAPPAAPENPFAELEAAVKKHDKPPETTRGAGEPPKPGEPVKPTEPVKPKPEPPREPKELRAELDRARQEAATASSSLQALQQKIKEYELRGEDTKKLMDRHTILEKELADARAEVRAIKQEADPKFIQQYKKPFDDAAAYARHVIEQLSVVDEEGQPTRQANVDDLQELYAMPINKASQVARKMFGDDSPTVINHLNELHRLNYNYQNALKEERAHAAEKAKAEEGQAVAHREQLSKAYQQVSKELAETVEDYHDSPEDKEAMEMRNKGYAIFDQKPDNTEKAVIKQAHIRQMVASFFPMKLQITRLKNEVAQLKAKLGTEKEADPHKVKHPGGAPTTTVDPNETWEQAARKELL